MTKKKNQNKSTTVIVNNSQPKSKRKRSGVNRRRTSEWCDAVLNPFGANNVHIPDEKTRPSGLVTSTLHFQHKPQTYNAGTSLTHTGGILVRPYPARWIYELGEDTGSGIRPNRALLNSDTNAGMKFYNVPNLTSMIGDYGYASNPTYSSALVRCVAMGVRISYEGTENNRAGSYIGVQVENSSDAVAFTTADSGAVNYHFDPLSVYQTFATQSQNLPPALWLNLATRSSRSRVTDGVFEFVWVPNGAPSYQVVQTTLQSDLYYSTSSGATSRSTTFGTFNGTTGLEHGAGGIMVMIEGDTVSTAAANGNNYLVDVVAHWEVVPHDLYAITYPLSLSAFAPIALAKALNEFGSAISGSTRANVNSGQVGTTSLTSMSSFSGPSKQQLHGAYNMLSSLIGYATAGAGAYATHRITNGNGNNRRRIGAP